MSSARSFMEHNLYSVFILTPQVTDVQYQTKTHLASEFLRSAIASSAGVRWCGSIEMTSCHRAMYTLLGENQRALDSFTGKALDDGDTSRIHRGLAYRTLLFRS